MKKLVSLLLIMCLLCCTGAAYAVEPIKVSITPLNPQTGNVISSPSYTDNTLFAVQVDIDIPRFTDSSDLDLKLEIAGVEITNHNLKLLTGTYYVEGVVLDLPSSLTVRINDMALENAVTAEDYYYAMQIDRSVCATYCFAQSATTSQGSLNTIMPPKTGDAPIRWTGAVLLGLTSVCASIKWRRVLRR